MGVECVIGLHAGGRAVTIDRRKVLTGLTALAASTATPAWAQFGNAIQPQNDPWAQVDPYADPRNGFPSQPARPFSEARPGDRGHDGGVFRAAEGRQTGPRSSQEDLAKMTMADLLADPEAVEIGSGQYGIGLALNGKSSQGGVIRNDAVQQALRRFCEPFLNIAERPHLPWEVYLTDFPLPNGLAYGGGKITIAVGTLIYADHPSEFASTIVHEIGHNDRRHIGQAIETEAMMTLLRSGDITAAGSAGEAFKKLNPMYVDLLDKGFSRLQEREADAHVPFMYDQLGMDTGRAIIKFRKMMKLYGKDPNKKTCLTDTHPVMMERIELLQAKVRPVRHEFTPPGWEELKRFFPTPSEYRWG